VIPSSTPLPTLTPFATTLADAIIGSGYQVLFDTDFAPGWDSGWATYQGPPANSHCISSSNSDNSYVLSIIYGGDCANNFAVVEPWSPGMYANGAISTAFRVIGSATVGVEARAPGNGLSYSLNDRVVDARTDLVCLGK
jgi:hypothetical protein